MIKEFKSLLEKDESSIEPSILEMCEILTEGTRAIESNKLKISDSRIEKIIDRCGQYFRLQKNNLDSFKKEDEEAFRNKFDAFVEAIQEKSTELKLSRYSDDFDYANQRDEEIREIVEKALGIESKAKKNKEFFKVIEEKQLNVLSISEITELLNKGASKIGTKELPFSGDKIDKIINQCGCFFKSQRKNPNMFSKESFAKFEDGFNSFVESFDKKNSELRLERISLDDHDQISIRQNDFNKLVDEISK